MTQQVKKKLQALLEQKQKQYEKVMQTIEDVDPEEWQVSRKLIKGTAIIAVMGATGAGKSSLIGALGGKAVATLEAPVVGHGSDSATKDINPFVTWHNTQKICFLDTPGFDDPDKGDDQILQQLAEYLTTVYGSNQRLAGVIYVHNITEIRQSRTSLHNRDLLQAVCGKKAMEAVSMVTTFWDSARGQDSSESTNIWALKRRENDLRTNYWKEQVEGGAQLFRSSRYPEDGTPELLDKILRTSKGTTLLLSDELLHRKPLAATTAGMFLQNTYADNSWKDKIVEKETELERIEDHIRRDRAEKLPTGVLEVDKAEIELEIKHLKAEKARAAQEYADRLNAWSFSGLLGAGVGIPAAGGAGVGALAGVAIVGLAEGTAVATGAAVASGIMGALAAGGIGIVVVGGILLAQKVSRDKKARMAEAEAEKDKLAKAEAEVSLLQRKVEAIDGILAGSLDQILASLKSSAKTSPNRLLEPRRYFRDLLALQQDIMTWSAAANALKKPLANSFCKVDLLPSTTETTLKATEVLDAHIDKTRNDSHSVVLSHLLQCRNVIQHVIYNLQRLKCAGRLDDRLSLLVVEPDRPDIANLRSIMLTDVRSLAQQFVIAVEEAATPVNKRSLDELMRMCADMLLRLGLMNKQHTAQATHVLIWRLTVHTIDTAVLVYACSHVKATTDQFFPEGTDKMTIPGLFATPGAWSPDIIVRPRQLGCLNGYLDGSNVWVFHALGAKGDGGDQTRLQLACQAEDLADIWGPLSMLKDRFGKTSAYKLGTGIISPWPKPAGLTTKIHEIYCHWEQDALVTQSSDHGDRAEFTESSILVIGAAVNLQSNRDCRNRNDDMFRAVLRMRRFHPLNTQRQYDIVDSRTQETTVGISKISVFQGKFGRQLKRSPDHFSWKDSILAQWAAENENPDFKSLSTMIGLEISLCTSNARRVALHRIVLADSLRHCFHTEHEHGKILTNLLRQRNGEPDLLQKLWDEQAELRKQLQAGIYKALYCARQTGFIKEGTNGRTFYAYWNPPDNSTTSGRVTFPELGWMQLMKDDVASGCFAVVAPECLESEHSEGRRCRAYLDGSAECQQKATLETSIQFERKKPPAGVIWTGDNFICTDKALNLKWSAEAKGFFGLTTQGISSTAILDTPNNLGLATTWSTHIGSSASRVPLIECPVESEMRNSLPILIV